MSVLQTTRVVSTLVVVVSLLPCVHAAPHSWRYVFPFFPAELDILVGHLATSIKRLQEVLDQCTEMMEGEWEGGDNPLGVMRLSAPVAEKNGHDMEDKVEQILEMRETIGELEDKIEKCRFHFWTGQEAKD